MRSATVVVDAFVLVCALSVDVVVCCVVIDPSRKPSMTFGAPSGSSNGAKGNSSSSNGKANAVAAGPNGKNKELAARQQKGAAQTNARKRRLLGVIILRMKTFVFLCTVKVLQSCSASSLTTIFGGRTVWRNLNL